MHIIVVNDRLGIGGGQDRAAIDYALGLRRYGHAVSFLAGFGEDLFGLRDAGIRVLISGHQDLLHHPNRLRGAIAGLHNADSAHCLHRLMRLSPDPQTLVYVHSFSKVHSASVILAAKHLGIRTVLDINDYFAACPTGTFFDHGRGEVCRRMPLSLSCIGAQCDSRNRVFKLYRLLRHVAQRLQGIPSRVDGFVIHSRLARTVHDPFLPANAPVLLLSNPITIANQGRMEAESNRDLLIAGRLTPEKGVVFAARAARLADFPLIVCGDGPEKERMREAHPQAKFLGWLNSEGVAHAIQNARALLFPSVWYEVQPMVVQEALARGLPVVTTHISAASDHVEDRRNGLIVDPSDVDAFAMALRTLHDEVFVRKLSQASYDRYWSNPADLSHVIPPLAQFLQQVADFRPPLS